MNGLELWLGTEQDYYELQRLLSTPVSPEAQLSWRQAENEESPINVEIHDGVGVMQISGPMVTASSFFTRLFGVISYDDIQESLLELGGNPKVQSVLMDFDTSGGSAEGCKRCAKFIRGFAETVKPVVSFTASKAASAGLWLYSAALGHYLDEDAQVGSLGALIIHTEFSEMDKKMGINRTVFRSAPYKALGTPYEKLSDKAEAQINEELQYLHNLFVTGIADLSEIPEETVAKKIATGKMFRAPQAVELGLSDNVLRFGEVVDKLANQYRAKPDKSPRK